MRLLPRHLCCLFLAFGSVASAAGSWDGQWFLMAHKSRISDHSFTLRKLPNGMWRYDDGAAVYLFATDRKPYPEPLEPDFTIVASQGASGSLDFEEEGLGKPIQRFNKTLSGDGKHLTGSHTYISPQGKEYSEPIVDVRVGSGIGFEGTWRELADAEPEAPATKSTTKAPTTSMPPHVDHPFWVISTAADGEMSWHIPATGETLKGKLDGQVRPITGLQQPPGASFYWNQVSTKQIEFYAMDSGHIVERATERLSLDGKTWSDTLWTPAYPNEQDFRVFERR